MPDQQAITEPPKQEFCSKSGLKHRGWTETAIERFLGAPDKEAPNPHYKSAAPMKLYKLSRFEEIESSQAFLQIGFKGARKLPISIVEMNCPFARVDSYKCNNSIVDRIWNTNMQEIRCIS